VLDTSKHTDVATAPAQENLPAGRRFFLIHDFSQLFEFPEGHERRLSKHLRVCMLGARMPESGQLKTTQASAAQLIKTIRTYQPFGPYHLCGWGLTAALVYEMACQLIGQDESVQFLGLVSLSHGRSLNTFFEARSRESEAPVVDELNGFDAVSTEYLPRPLPIPIHLFEAGDGPAESRAPEQRGLDWDSLIDRTNLRQVLIPVFRHELMTPEGLDKLGQVIAGILFDQLHPLEFPELTYRPHVPLQRGVTGRTPVFCLPGAGDSVTRMVQFASALGPEWPVHGLQPRGLDGQLVPHTTIEAAAEKYLQAIEKIHPKGDIHLVGHSFGGWAALEIAIRMTSAGRGISSLTLIDTDAAGDSEADGQQYTELEALLEYAKLVEMSSDKSIHVPKEALLHRTHGTRLEVLHEAMVRARILPRTTHPSLLRGPTSVFSSALRTSYVPRGFYSGKARLVLLPKTDTSEPQNKLRQTRTAAAWRAWVPNLEVWEGPGNHMTVLQPPNVAQLAAWWINHETN